MKSQGILRVQYDPSYGRELFRPQCLKSERLAHLLGVQTFTREKLNELKDIGYEIRIEQKEVKL